MGLKVACYISAIWHAPRTAILLLEIGKNKLSENISNWHDCVTNLVYELHMIQKWGEEAFFALYLNVVK